VTARRSTLVSCFHRLDKGEAHGHSGGLAPATVHHPIASTTEPEWDMGGDGLLWGPEAAGGGVRHESTAAQGRAPSREAAARSRPLPSPWVSLEVLRPSCMAPCILLIQRRSQLSGYSAYC